MLECSIPLPITETQDLFPKHVTYPTPKRSQGATSLYLIAAGTLHVTPINVCCSSFFVKQRDNAKQLSLVEERKFFFFSLKSRNDFPHKFCVLVYVIAIFKKLNFIKKNG